MNDVLAPFVLKPETNNQTLSYGGGALGGGGSRGGNPSLSELAFRRATIMEKMWFLACVAPVLAASPGRTSTNCKTATQ